MQGQLLNELTQQYADLSINWLDVLLPMAQRLFVTLATIELAWSGIWWAMIARKDENLIANLLHKVMVIMFFYTVILFAPSWIPFIVSGFIEAGSAASGWSSLNPSNVLQIGLDTAAVLWDAITQVYNWWNMPLDLLFAPLLLIAAFTIIAGILVVTLIESFIVIGGGVLMLGFAGSRWTTTLAEGYLLYAIKVGIRLFVLFLLIGAGMSLPQTWVDIISAADPTIGASRRFVYEILSSSFVLALVVWRAPHFAASMIHFRAQLGMDRAYSDVG